MRQHPLRSPNRLAAPYPARSDPQRRARLLAAERGNLKAVILAGGKGTRLLPLTAATPKPLIPLVNRPLLDHILHLLRTHGITDIVLAMAYLADNFRAVYGDGSDLGVKLTYASEPEPQGTGGAIKNVEPYLDPGDTFLVLSGDVITGIDLTAMLRFHKQSGSICTIAVAEVEDPTSYGAVDLEPNGRILRFTEKPRPGETRSTSVSTGTYIMEPAILAHIPAGEYHMVERGLFPTLLVLSDPLYAYRTPAYWIDIGTPAKYLQAHAGLLNGALPDGLTPQGELVASGIWAGEGTFIDSSVTITPPLVVGRHCSIEARAHIVGPTVLGDDCRVANDAHLQRLVAWQGAALGPSCDCSDSILATNARLGPNTTLEPTTAIGPNATIGANNRLPPNTTIAPDTFLPDKC
ncbi:MAG: sugar phosphate nucleotidyltransferase [Chloroflexia bacterium]